MKVEKLVEVLKNTPADTWVVRPSFDHHFRTILTPKVEKALYSHRTKAFSEYYEGEPIPPECIVVNVLVIE